MRLALLASARSLHTRRWATWLAARGHHVRVFSDLAPHTDWPAQAIPVVAPQWTLWRKLTTFKLRGGRYANSREKWRAYADALRAFAPDVLHAMEAVNYGPSLVHFPQYARVLTPWGRDIESLAWPHIDAERARLVRAGCAAADVIATNAPGLDDHWAALMGVPRDKLRLFPWGIDAATFSPRPADQGRALRDRLGLPADAPLVLSPRRADPYYGVGQMTEAWRGLDTDARLVILRAGASDNHWHEMQAAAGAMPRLHWVDRLLTPHEMATLLSTSAFVLMAPRTDLLACTLLEAMACGSVPIVAPNPAYAAAITNIGTSPWPAERGVGIVADGHDSDDLRRALERGLALGPDHRRAAAGHNAEVMLRHFSWDSHAGAMEQACELALARTRRTT